MPSLAPWFPFVVFTVALGLPLRAQEEERISRAIEALESSDRSERERGLEVLVRELTLEHRSSVHAVLERLEEGPGATRLAWERLFALRSDLLPLLLEALLGEHAGRHAAARSLLTEHLASHVRSRAAREPARPLAVVFATTPWAFEPLDVRDLLRDLRHLARPAVPAFLDPELDLPLPLREVSDLDRSLPPPAVWILGAIRQRECLVRRLEGTLFVTRESTNLAWGLHEFLDSWLTRTSRSEVGVAAAVEALTAMRVPGWHGAVESLLASGNLPSADWARGLVFGGAPEVDSALDPRTVEALLLLDPWSPDGERYLVRYVVQRLWLQRERDGFLEVVRAVADANAGGVAGRAIRVGAWFQPSDYAPELLRWLREGNVDEAVFAWRVLERSGGDVAPTFAAERARRSAEDDRIRALFLRGLDDQGPLDAAALAENHERLGTKAFAAAPEDAWRLALDVRARDTATVRRALETVLRSERVAPREIVLQSIAAHLQHPEAHAVLLATFRSWAADWMRDPARFARLQELAAEVGILVSAFGVSEGAGGVGWRPRLRDADPYEGGFWERP